MEGRWQVPCTDQESEGGTSQRKGEHQDIYDLKIIMVYDVESIGIVNIVASVTGVLDQENFLYLRIKGVTT